MTTLAVQPVGACVLIVDYFIACVPMRALLILIRVVIWLTSKVLPVMRKNALYAVMVLISVRAPSCLEMEGVKVEVFFEYVE